MIRLTRIDPDQNMSRYYQLHLQPGLFGDCDLVREWGRIGSSGTIRTSPYPTLAAATAALAEAVTQRHKRGYRAIDPRCSRDFKRVQAAGRQACAPVRQLSELDRPAWACNVEAHT
jgi:predicted DNA-binding WGR domain protein